MKITEILSEAKAVKQRLDPKCWKGKHKEGTKVKGGVRVNNCVPNESVEEAANAAQQAAIAIAKKKKKSAPNESVEESGLQRYTGIKKYGKKGFEELQKAGREGADEEEKGRIKDKYLPKKESVEEEWSKKYKNSINCSHPKGFSQKAHCAGKKKHNESVEMEMTCPDCGISEGYELDRIRQLSGLTNEDFEQQFDLIEEMVEALAEAHGVDSEVIWEDFETVDDHELLDESAAWHRKAGKSKSGGLNKKGVASYRREHPGSKLQTAVTTKPSKLKKGSKAAKRRKSFCARMGGMKGAMKKPNGKPTRKALALRKWHC